MENNLIIQSYLLKYKTMNFTIERAPRGVDIFWAVRQGDFCLSKSRGMIWEPSPSGRDDEFFEECRYDSVEEAHTALQQYLKELEEVLNEHN